VQSLDETRSIAVTASQSIGRRTYALGRTDGRRESAMFYGVIWCPTTVVSVQRLRPCFSRCGPPRVGVRRFQRCKLRSHAARHLSARLLAAAGTSSNRRRRIRASCSRQATNSWVAVRRRVVRADSVACVVVSLAGRRTDAVQLAVKLRRLQVPDNRAAPRRAAPLADGNCLRAERARHQNVRGRVQPPRQ